MPRDSQDLLAALSAADSSAESPSAAHHFSSAEMLAILRERGWLVGEPSVEQVAWSERAAALLGPHAENRSALTELLGLVFHYDAHELLTKVENHVVLSRYAARDVVRHLALLLLEPEPLSVERFKEIITALKEGLQLRGRELFHPIRLALAGRAGEGELDRVILLLDEAAGLNFTVPVKSARQRILEFCASLD
jgi:nondiscriminating glutamyl-tRNA synthetase